MRHEIAQVDGKGVVFCHASERAYDACGGECFAPCPYLRMEDGTPAGDKCPKCGDPKCTWMDTCVECSIHQSYLDDAAVVCSECMWEHQCPHNDPLNCPTVQEATE